MIKQGADGRSIVVAARAPSISVTVWLRQAHKHVAVTASESLAPTPGGSPFPLVVAHKSTSSIFVAAWPRLIYRQREIGETLLIQLGHKLPHMDGLLGLREYRRGVQNQPDSHDNPYLLRSSARRSGVHLASNALSLARHRATPSSLIGMWANNGSVFQAGSAFTSSLMLSIVHMFFSSLEGTISRLWITFSSVHYGRPLMSMTRFAAG